MGVLNLVRHFLLADAEAGTDEPATCYIEYDGKFACRQFARHSDRVLVAPYDLPFLEALTLNGPPELGAPTPISMSEFERLWEVWAQPRLSQLAQGDEYPLHDRTIWYVRSPFPAQFKADEENASTFYTEFVDGIARRHFEAFADHALVAPCDGAWPEHYEDVVRAVDEGLDSSGVLIPLGLRPTQISHREFEEQWEQHALPRLQAIAQSSGS